MMSAEYIQSLADQAGNRARRNRTQPRAFTPAKLEQLGQPGARIPNIGSYRHPSWRLVEDRMVDKTGWGHEDEPALTIRSFKQWIAENPGSGFASIEEGQFQMVVGRFERAEEVAS